MIYRKALVYSCFAASFEKEISSLCIRINKINEVELVHLYFQLRAEFIGRKIARTGNITGEIGEHFVVNTYNNDASLPHLSLERVSTACFDATDTNMKRYSIKTTTTNITGVFYGIPREVFLIKLEERPFDYAVVCQLRDNYSRYRIIQIGWEILVKYLKWHSRVNGYYLSVTKALINESGIIIKEGEFYPESE